MLISYLCISGKRFFTSPFSLCDRTERSILNFYFLVGLKGIQIGAALGGGLALPITAIEIAMRLYVTDDDLMPSVVLFSEVPEANMQGALTNQLIKEAELEKELDKLEPNNPRLR